MSDQELTSSPSENRERKRRSAESISQHKDEQEKEKDCGPPKQPRPNSPSSSMKNLTESRDDLATGNTEVSSPLSVHDQVLGNSDSDEVVDVETVEPRDNDSVNDQVTGKNDNEEEDDAAADPVGQEVIVMSNEEELAGAHKAVAEEGVGDFEVIVVSDDSQSETGKDVAGKDKMLDEEIIVETVVKSDMMEMPKGSEFEGDKATLVTDEGSVIDYSMPRNDDQTSVEINNKETPVASVIPGQDDLMEGQDMVETDNNKTGTDCEKLPDEPQLDLQQNQEKERRTGQPGSSQESHAECSGKE